MFRIFWCINIQYWRNILENMLIYDLEGGVLQVNISRRKDNFSHTILLAKQFSANSFYTFYSVINLYTLKCSEISLFKNMTKNRVCSFKIITFKNLRNYARIKLQKFNFFTWNSVLKKFRKLRKKTFSQNTKMHWKMAVESQKNHSV